MSDAAHAFDVIVVGCGIAGLSAAVSAQEAGARVALLERAPKEDRGGNTRYTESFWRMKSRDEVSDDLEEQLAANAGGHLDPEIIRDAALPYEDWPPLLKGLGFTDPEVISTLANNAGPTLNWLSGFGVTFDFLPNYFITQSTTRMAPAVNRVLPPASSSGARSSMTTFSAPASFAASAAQPAALPAPTTMTSHSASDIFFSSWDADIKNSALP